MFYDRPFYNLRRDNPNSSVFSKDKAYCMCDEYDFIRNFLKSNPMLENRFAALLALHRMYQYNFTLNRIEDEYKREFLERYAADFLKIKEKYELDKSLFTETEWERLNDIMECPDYVYFRDYYQNGKLSRMIKNQQKELDGIYRSP